MSLQSLVLAYAALNQLAVSTMEDRSSSFTSEAFGELQSPGTQVLDISPAFESTWKMNSSSDLKGAWASLEQHEEQISSLRDGIDGNYRLSHRQERRITRLTEKQNEYVGRLTSLPVPQTNNL